MPRFPLLALNVQTVRFKLFSAVVVIALFSAMAGGAGLFYLKKIAMLDDRLSTVNDPLLQVAMNMRNQAGAATTALLRSLVLNTHDARYAADAQQERALAAVEDGYREMGRLFAIEGEDRDLTPYRTVSNTLFADLEQLNGNLHTLMMETEEMNGHIGEAEGLLDDVVGISKTVLIAVETLHSDLAKGPKPLPVSGALTSQGNQFDRTGQSSAFALVRSADTLLYLIVRLRQQLEAMVDSKTAKELNANRFMLVDNLKNTILETQVFASHDDADLRSNGTKLVNKFKRLDELAVGESGIADHVKALIQTRDTSLEMQATVENDTVAFAQSMAEVIQHMRDEKEEALVLAAQTSGWAKKVVGFFVVLAAAVAIGIAGALTRSLVRPVRSLTDVMQRLSGGDLDVEIPARNRADEIGAMANATQVFKEAALQKKALEIEAKANHEATLKAEKEQREHEQNAVREFGELVAKAASGDFTGRLEVDDKDGFLLALANSLNLMVETVDKGLGETVTVLSGLSAGDLSLRMFGNYQGRFSQLKDGANGMAEKIGDIVGRIAGSTDSVLLTASEMDTGASDLSARAEQQAASLEETAAAMEEMSAAVRTNAGNANEANKLAIETREQAEHGRELVAETVQAMSSIRESSAEIGEIVSTIEAIAFQTNLLALNAAVEAARAGDAGKGFAVVAAEVRTLAQRSGDAAKTIKDLISKSSENVEAGDRLVGVTGQALTEILDSVRNVAGRIEEIAEASKEQTAGVEEVSVTVSQMDQLTQQNSQLADRSAAAARNLTVEARTVVDLVGFFSTSGEIGTKAPQESSAPEREVRNWQSDAVEEKNAPDVSPAVERRRVASAGNWSEY